MKDLLSAVCLTVGIHSDVTNQRIHLPQQSVLEKNYHDEWFRNSQDSNPTAKQMKEKTHNKIDDSYWLCQTLQYGKEKFIAVPSPYAEHPVLGVTYSTLFEQNKANDERWAEVEARFEIRDDDPGFRKYASGLLDYWCAFSLGSWTGASQEPQGEIMFTQRPNVNVKSFNMVTNIYATQHPEKLQTPRWTSISIRKQVVQSPLKNRKQVAFFTADHIETNEKKITKAGQKKGT